MASCRGAGCVPGASILRAPLEEAGGRSSPQTSPGPCRLQIQDIVRRRQLLTIFREGKDGQQDVDVAILQALLKGEGRARWCGGRSGGEVPGAPSLEAPKTRP